MSKVFYYDGSIEVPEDVTEVIIKDSVTRLRNFEFNWCTNLTSITIPDSVTSIGECAFYSLYRLNWIYYNGKIFSKEEFESLVCGKHILDFQSRSRL